MVVTDISDKDGENIHDTFNRGGCLKGGLFTVLY